MRKFRNLELLFYFENLLIKTWKHRKSCNEQEAAEISTVSATFQPISESLHSRGNSIKLNNKVYIIPFQISKRLQLFDSYAPVPYKLMLVTH